MIIIVRMLKQKEEVLFIVILVVNRRQMLIKEVLNWVSSLVIQQEMIVKSRISLNNLRDPMKNKKMRRKRKSQLKF